MKYPYILIVLILTLLFNICYGDSPLSADLKLYGTYIDNIYQTSYPESDYISLTKLNLSYNLKTSASIFYDGSLNLFTKHSDLHNHDHSIGLEYSRTIFQDKGNLYFGSKAGFRKNTSLYDYDRYNGVIYSDLKYYLTETFTTKTGYGLDYERYPNYPAFNSLENYGFIQLNKSFQTKTSLQLNLETGRKDYSNLTDNSSSDYAIHLTGSARVAQSLGDNTGIQLQYSWHHAPKNIRFDDILENGYFFVEDIVEDEYSFSSHEYRMTIKHLGPWNTTLKGTFSRENRFYNISISKDNVNRKDKNTSFHFEFEKKISLFSIRNLALQLEFFQKMSNSNDQYFDHSTKILSIGTKAAF